MFNKLEKYLSGKSKAFVSVISIILVLFIGFLDYITGYEIILSVFYVIPVALVAWFSGKWPSFVISLFSIIIWILADYFAGFRYSHPVIATWNAVVRLSFLVILGYLFFNLKRHRLILEEEIKRKSNDLLEAQKRLLESEKLALLGQLSTGLVHEISNPLYGICNYIEVISKEQITDKQKKYFPLILQGIEMIQTTANNLLNMAQINKLELTQIDITDLIKEVLTFLKPRCEDERVEINTTFQDKLPLIQADKNKIKQVLLNILLNALEAVYDTGRIDIKASSEHKHIIISITDNGCGISHVELPHIFQPFVSGAKKKRERGVGLGLFMVSNIITAHQGKIDVVSQEGKGTAFTITLPQGINNDT
ncbi:MAG: ATP-binding protein [Planctomycetota bacterium]